MADEQTDPIQDQQDDQAEREQDLLEKLGLHPAQLSVQQHLLSLADQGHPQPATEHASIEAPTAAHTPNGAPGAMPRMQGSTPVTLPASGATAAPSASMPAFPDSATPPGSAKPGAVPPIVRNPSMFSAAEDKISQKHHIWGGVLKGLDVAGSILAPGAMTMIPGSLLNQKARDAGSNNTVALRTKLRQENSLADQEEAKADALRHPKPAHPKVLMDSGVPYAVEKGDQQWVIGAHDMPPDVQSVSDAALAAHAQRVAESHDKPDTTAEAAKHKDDLEGKLRGGSIADEERQELAILQRKEKLQGVSAEATAQVGRPPVPADYPKGEMDPLYKTANKAWGKEIQRIKGEEAAVGAVARNKSFEDTPYNVLNKHTMVMDVMTRGELAAKNAANPGTWVLATQGGMASAGKEANAENIRTSMENVKDHTAVLDKGLTHRGLIAAALADPSNTAVEFMQSAAAGQLEPPEQDYVIAVLNAREQIQGLRSMLMASGNSDARIRAIIKTLPGASTPSSAYANKQIDTAMADIDREMKGVPKVRTPGRDNQNKKTPGKVSPTSTNKDSDIGFLPAQ